MSKLYAARTVSPTRGRIVSPNSKQTGSSPKRKPFISTTKGAASFGEPPPLPPRPPSPERQVELAQQAQQQSMQNNFAAQQSATVPIEPDILSPSHTQSLQKQSFRWLNLTATFWSLIVLDTNRSVDRSTLDNFFDVMDWRAHGKITEQEFSALFNEWIGKPSSGGSSGSKRKHTVGVFAVRQLLLERRCVESDLDLLIGMIIHETNRSILNSPINFMSRDSKASANGNTNNLEICTRRWIALSEELFFSLDTPGYGFLRFDEFFFLASCLTVGLQGWNDETEVEADLSIGSLAAIALQMMREAGAAVMITSNRKELLAVSLGASQKGLQALQQDRSDIIDSSSVSISMGTLGQGLGEVKSNSALNHKMGLGTKSSFPSYGKYSVTLPMFKALLLKRGLGESALAALSVHVQSCLERLARITSECSNELYQSCKPLENRSTIGSPRLWQQAVLTAAGYDCEQEKLVTPPLLLFLLSDAEKLIPGALRASESGSSTAAAAFSDSGMASSTVAPSINPDHNINTKAVGRVNRLNAVDELHETSYQLWQAFKNWGASKGNSSSNKSNQNTHAGSEESLKDPAYQLILSSLIEYKILQHQLCAAFFDLTMAYFGLGGGANAVSLMCAKLMPNPESMIIDLGLDGGKGGDAERYDQQQASRYGSIYQNIIDKTSGSPSGSRFEENFMKAHSSPPTAGSPYARAQRITAFLPTLEDDGFDASPGKSSQPSSFVIEEGTGTLKPKADSTATSPPSPSHHSSANWKLVFDARTESLQPPPRSPTRSSMTGNNSSPTRELGWSGSAQPPNAANAVNAISTSSGGGALGNTTSSVSNAMLESLLLERLLSATDPKVQLELVEQLKVVRQANSGGEINSKLVSQAVANSMSNSPGDKKDSSAKAAAVPDAHRERAGSPGRDRDRERDSRRGSQRDEQAKQSKIPIIEKSRRTSRSDEFLSSGSEFVPAKLDGNVDRLLKRREKNNKLAVAQAIPSIDEIEQNNSPPPSETGSGTVASSIAQLLAEGQSAGKYAQTLREILRKMSKDNSNVQLKSLEQILQLGHSIAKAGDVKYRSSDKENELRGREKHRPRHSSASPGHRRHESLDRRTSAYASNEETEDISSFDNAARQQHRAHRTNSAEGRRSIERFPSDTSDRDLFAQSRAEAHNRRTRSSVSPPKRQTSQYDVDEDRYGSRMQRSELFTEARSSRNASLQGLSGTSRSRSAARQAPESAHRSRSVDSSNPLSRSAAASSNSKSYPQRASLSSRQKSSGQGGIPGLMPHRLESRGPRKAFGHPV